MGLQKGLNGGKLILFYMADYEHTLPRLKCLGGAAGLSVGTAEKAYFFPPGTAFDRICSYGIVYYVPGDTKVEREVKTMNTITDEYKLLFNVITDATNQLDQLRYMLEIAQMQAEELYISEN